MDTVITSTQNSQVKDALKLRDRRPREESSLFLIEGYRELKRAVDAGRVVETLFYCPDFFLGTNENDLIAQCKGAKKLILAPHVFEKLSYRDRPDGLLAVAKQKHVSLSDLTLSKNPFFLVAEKIEKPGNLGTILRSSDAAGCDAVIVADPTTDIHNPNVVRSSVGTLFTVPVAEATSEETIAYLKKHKIAIVSASPHAKLNFTEAPLSGPIAIVVGTEQYGLTEEWMQQADVLVRIPMLGVADSLNVASATTLLLYEALRQRNSIRR